MGLTPDGLFPNFLDAKDRIGRMRREMRWGIAVGAAFAAALLLFAFPSGREAKREGAARIARPARVAESRREERPRREEEARREAVLETEREARTEPPPPTATPTALPVVEGSGPGVLEIVVKDDRGFPIEGAEARVDWKPENAYAQYVTKPTDARGRAVFELAPGGGYYLWVQAPGHVVWSPEGARTVAAGERRTIEAMLLRQGTLRISVMGATSPMLNLGVTGPKLRGPFSNGFHLDETGHYDVALDPGPIEARVVSRDEPLGSAAQSLVIAPGAIVDAVFQLVPFPTFVVGHVRRADDGRPVAGADVYYQSSGMGYAKTDEDGAFALRQATPPDGISAKAPGFFSSGILTFAPDTVWPAEVTLELRPMATIVVTVSDRDGKPIAGVPVAVTKLKRQRQTDEKGRSEFSLDPGRYEVAIEGESAPPPQTVEVAQGEEAAVRFTLAAGVR
jgi:hypothetical protein